jgi:hypothetical protein
MSVDLGTLHIKVKSDEAVTGKKRLDELAKSGTKAETATDWPGKATARITKAWGRSRTGAVGAGIAAVGLLAKTIHDGHNGRCRLGSADASDRSRILNATGYAAGMAAGAARGPRQGPGPRHARQQDRDHGRDQRPAHLPICSGRNLPAGDRARADMSSVFGGDMKIAVMQLGKALEDPIRA